MRMCELVDKARRAGKWYSVDNYGAHGGATYTRRTVVHYSTAMLSFNIGEDGLWDGNTETVDYSIGHGSVSDQNGMNQLFARAAMPFAYCRDRRGGGARIERLQSANYRYGVTREDMYARAMRSVTIGEVLSTWPVKGLVQV